MGQILRKTCVALSLSFALFGAGAFALDPSEEAETMATQTLTCPAPCTGTVKCQAAQVAVCDHGACACRAATPVQPEK
jgi:hypothetical protein